MRIGIDFDNTIVCYDSLFHQLAAERGLIPAGLPADKESVRNFLREQGREDDWTELQGLAYGLRIGEAVAFANVRSFLCRCRAAAIPTWIISHKTRRPFRGPQADLHEAARGWLREQGFHAADGPGLLDEQVIFEETKAGKLRRIAELRCTHFIDDLPEFLDAPNFPPDVERVLFDPQERHAGKSAFPCISSWQLMAERLLDGK
jgi:hypothetical protein